MNKKRAVCLLSGGLDSTTTLYWAIRQGYQTFALTVDYGQIHVCELKSAKKITSKLKIEHQIISIQMPWKGSALLDRNISIPQKRNLDLISQKIPSTYVPARNTILVSLAASYAEAKNAEAIFIGANALDYSGYPDCRPEYFHELERVLQKGTKVGIEGNPIQIKTPLIDLSKAQIIQLAMTLKVPLNLTWSCYQGKKAPCGVCDSCLLREKGFQELGLSDPALKK